MYEINKAVLAQKEFKLVPAPARGELIRKFGNILRQNKNELAKMVTHESKKIYTESLGEVQEMIDICDFAVGLSRQLYGLTMPSERTNHRIQELWHPLGVVGVISAFNFPVAVWAWNHALAIVCGNSVVWKPSLKSINCATICKTLWDGICSTDLERDLLQLKFGGNDAAIKLAESKEIALLSATGSTEMGKVIAPIVAARLGRGLYELGGNNAMIVSKTADLDLAVRAIVFSAVGTCGQRCTTLRRLIIEETIYDELLLRIKNAYNSVVIGDPMDPKTLVGPLIDEHAFTRMQDVLMICKNKGYKIHGGNPVYPLDTNLKYYVQPAIIEITEQCEIVKQETFAPILYTMKYNNLNEAISLQNDVPQGLSSSIFTDSFKESEYFLSSSGSDCGLANVNVGTSGAEIGAAFGGEKDTGGGRESGSDSWKNYMRRASCTVNFGNDLPLSQGINFN